MSNAIEIEAKALITQEDYRKLINDFRGHSRYMQTNYYIDTEDRALAKEGFALRIREKQGEYEMTFKTPLSEGLLEKNTPITMTQFADFRDFNEFPKVNLTTFLMQLDVEVEKLRILTSLSTERLDVEYKGGLLSMDRNTYSGKVDYEVEFEYNSMKGAQEILKGLLEEKDIKCVFSEQTKVHRAMAAIGK